MVKRKFTDEHIRKLRESHLGQKSFWKGKKFSEEHKNNLSDSHKGLHISPATEFKKGSTSWNKGKKGLAGERNGMWKGNNVGYYALHAWVKRNLGKPIQCLHCPSVKNIQWANVSHEYTREREDWIQLCVPCHRKYDKDYPKAIEQYKNMLTTNI